MYVSCPLPMRFSQGSKGGPSCLPPCHQYPEKMYMKMYIIMTFISVFFLYYYFYFFIFFFFLVLALFRSLALFAFFAILSLFCGFSTLDLFLRCQWFDDGETKILVLLSPSVERFGVSRMPDFFSFNSLASEQHPKYERVKKFNLIGSRKLQLEKVWKGIRKGQLPTGLPNLIGEFCNFSLRKCFPIFQNIFKKKIMFKWF